MIKNSDSSNVVFTDEQTRQLSEWRGRLMTVQEEIRFATDRREALLNEVNELKKQQAYYDGLVTTLGIQVDELKKTKEELSTNVKDSHSKLIEHEKFTKTYHESMSDRRAEVEKLEKEIKEKSIVLTEEIAKHNDRTTKLSEQKLLVDRAREAFLKATESVTWS